MQMAFHNISSEYLGIRLITQNGQNLRHFPTGQTMFQAVQHIRSYCHPKNYCPLHIIFKKEHDNKPVPFSEWWIRGWEPRKAPNRATNPKGERAQQQCPLLAICCSHIFLRIVNKQ